MKIEIKNINKIITCMRYRSATSSYNNKFIITTSMIIYNI